MSDSLFASALLPRTSGLPAPVVANPLAAVSDAATAAERVYAVRAKQSEQAIGQILQQSTDANGNVDYGKAHALAAQAGPDVALGMQDMLLNTSRLRGEQQEQTIRYMSTIGRASLSIMNDPSDANMRAVYNDLRNAGVPQSQLDAEFGPMMQPGVTAQQRQQWATRHGLTAMEAGAGMGRATGAVSPADLGDVTLPQRVQQPLPGYGGGGITYGPGVTRGVTPGITYQGGEWVTGPDGQPQWVPGIKPVSPLFPPGGQPVPAPGQSTATPGGGSPPPIPKGQIPGGYRGGAATPGATSNLDGSVQVAGPGAPTTSAPSAPSAVVPGDVAAMQAGIARAQQAPAGGTQTAQNMPPSGVIQTPTGPMGVTGPPSGYGDMLSNDIKAQNDASLAQNAAQDRLTYGQNAMEALRMAGGYTGPGTGWEARVAAWLQSRGGRVDPKGAMSDTAWRQVLQKDLLNFAQDQGRRAGTDLGLETQLHSNANADEMLPTANRVALMQNIGILRRSIAQALEMPNPSGQGAVVKHMRTYTNETDPRGFVWDYYTDAEKDAIEDELKGKPRAQAKLDRAIHDAVKHGFFDVPPPAGKSSAPAPPASAPGITAPTGSGPTAANPLAAYA